MNDFTFEHERIEAVLGLRGGNVYLEPVRVEADTVIANCGPKATVALAGAEHFTPEYVRQTQELLKPAANIVYNFASREPLMSAPGRMI